MATYVQRRKHLHSVSYRVMFRVGSKQKSATFADPAGAADFADRVDKLGGEMALKLLAIRRGTAKARRVPTVAEAVFDHIDNRPNITDGTRSDYTKMGQLIAESYLGPLPVDGLTPDAINKWIHSQNVSAKTIRNRHGLLYAAMRRQVKLGNITANPCEETAPRRSSRPAITTITSDELDRILDKLDTYWHPLVITLAGTGLRFGEATALQVQDLDLTGRPPTLWVVRAWKHTNGKGHQLGPPKSEKGTRVVSIPPRVLVALRPLVVDKPRDAFVFANHRGSPIRQNSFHELWSKAVAQSGINKRPRIHDLRHSHVSALIAAGVPLPVIQRRIGHEQITTTIDTYGHLAEDALSIAAQAADNALPPTRPQLEA